MILGFQGCLLGILGLNWVIFGRLGGMGWSLEFDSSTVSINFCVRTYGPACVFECPAALYSVVCGSGVYRLSCVKWAFF